MRTTIITLLFAAIAFVQTGAQEKIIQSDISQITVFSEGAQITGTASAALQPGACDLVISGLSPDIDINSIQVTGEGDFMILGVIFRTNYLENLVESKKVSGLKSRIDVITVRIEDERTAVEVLKEKEQFLRSNYNVTAGKTSFTTEQLKAFYDLFSTNMESVKSSILKKNRSIKEMEEEKQKLQNQLDDNVAKAKMPTGEIVVSVNTSKSAAARLKVSYVVMQAGWYPSYDIRVNDIGEAASIIYKANIWQRTGIDWNDVKISLSSSSPMTAGALPLLYPWYIDFMAQRPQVRARGMASVKKAEVAYDESLVEYMEAPSAAMPVSISESATSFSFDVNVSQTILADGKPEVVELQRLTAPASYKYESVPKNNPSAYLMGYITDWNKYSLLPGSANIYFSNTFTGTGMINTAELTDTLPVSLGADKGITIKREKRVDYSSHKTVGLNVVETRSFLISVRNNKKQPVAIRLHDQVPLSQNSSITVEAEELTGGKLNSQTGEILWDLVVAPQETKNIVLTYSVKYPKSQKVILE